MRRSSCFGHVEQMDNMDWVKGCTKLAVGGMAPLWAEANMAGL